MKFPVLGQKQVIAASIITAILAVACLVVNVLFLPGWMYMGTAVLALLSVVYALFAVNWSPMAIRFGILIFVVCVGIQIIARKNPGLMGEFEFGQALGPVVNNIALLCGLPWFLMVMFSLPIAQRLTPNIYLRAILGAVLVFLPTIFFLYNADRLDILYWEELVPSMGAFITWFAAGFMLHFTGNQMQVKSENPMAIPLYVTWLAFNLLLFGIRLAMYVN